MLWGKLTKLFPSLLTPLLMMGKQPTLRSTSRRVTMSVLRSSGLHTSSAGLSRIRCDRLEAERLREQQAQDQRLLLAAEATIETGTVFDADNFHDTLQDNFDLTVHNIEDYDSDGSTRSDSSEARPLRSTEENLFSSYGLLRLNASSNRRRYDQRTQETRNANMHAAWSAQTQALADAYLHWKHGPRNNIDPESRQPVHHFHVSKVDVFVCEIAQNHEETANIALLRVGLLGCSPTMPTVAITLQCLELYHQL
ncbi:hypothetical protein P692DRAFT_201810454 [Suillus brevipes Sb2]|nr:hypothetical protein P692DRAFT_201810454 [Suillus brevipes Sb2]